MPDGDKIFNLVALRIWWRHVHTLLTTTYHSNKMYLLKCENFGVDKRYPITLILFVTRFSRVFSFGYFHVLRSLFPPELLIFVIEHSTILCDIEILTLTSICTNYVAWRRQFQSLTHSLRTHKLNRTEKFASAFKFCAEYSQINL